MLQLLREAKPDIKRVAALWSYVIPAFPKEEIEPAYSIAPHARLTWSFTSSRSRTPISHRLRSPRSTNGNQAAYC